jgi:hypothetical protein
MSIARHLAVVERLCGLDLSKRAPCGPGGVADGPGWRTAVLLRGGDSWEERCATEESEEETAEQLACEREALAERLRERWGEPQRVGLLGAAVRSAEGEEIPDPWRWLCHDLPEVHLWRVDDRWLALGVSRPDRELPHTLLAVVTHEDPP